MNQKVKFEITHTIPLSILIIIASISYSTYLFFKGYRITKFTDSQTDLLNKFLKLNDEEIKKEIIDEKTIKLNRGKGHFTDTKIDGIVFKCMKDKIIIGFGVKDKQAFIVSKDMQYYDEVTNDYKSFIESVKKKGFGKIVYADETAHLYFDGENTVNRIPCESFNALCVTLQLVTET